MSREMIAIESGEEGQVLFLQLAFQMRRWFEVQNARLRRAHNRPLKQGGNQPLDQLRTPSTGCPPGSVKTT